MRVPFLALHRSLGCAITANKIRGALQWYGAEVRNGSDSLVGEVGLVELVLPTGS